MKDGGRLEEKRRCTLATIRTFTQYRNQSSMEYYLIEGLRL